MCMKKTWVKHFYVIKFSFFGIELHTTVFACSQGTYIPRRTATFVAQLYLSTFQQTIILQSRKKFYRERCQLNCSGIQTVKSLTLSTYIH